VIISRSASDPDVQTWVKAARGDFGFHQAGTSIAFLIIFEIPGLNRDSSPCSLQMVRWV
jgi:hypothetical protein